MRVIINREPPEWTLFAGLLLMLFGSAVEYLTSERLFCIASAAVGAWLVTWWFFGTPEKHASLQKFSERTLRVCRGFFLVVSTLGSLGAITLFMFKLF